MVWEQGVSIIAMVTAEEVLCFQLSILLWFFYFFLPCSWTWMTFCTLSAAFRSEAERKASGTGPDSAHGTTRWHMGASKSRHASAQNPAATPPQGWRSNTCWRARRGRSGTCSTLTGRTMAVPTTWKDSSVSGKINAHWIIGDLRMNSHMTILFFQPF